MGLTNFDTKGNAIMVGAKSLNFIISELEHGIKILIGDEVECGD